MPLGAVAATNNGIVKFVRKLGAAIDSAALRGADRDYLAMPERPWQVMLRGSTNQGDLKMSTVIDGHALIGQEWGDVTMEPRMNTGVTQYVGVAANYRGYGLCYSEDVGGSRGSLLHLSVTGGCYGLNLRIHQYKTDEPEIRLTFDKPMPTDTTFYDIIPNPIKVRTMMLDAYYFFNSKRFSYCAAYDQSIIQKRSAGSPLVGAMYYHSTIAYDQDDNAELVMLMGDVGKIKHWQVSLGAGYAYNFVPCRGLLISAMAMPTVSVYNRLDSWSYTSDFYDKMIEQRRTGVEPTFVKSDYEIRPTGHDRHTSSTTFNVDARLSITYNIGNIFFNANGQFNHFRYSFTKQSGRFNDWYINTAIGIRL